MSQGPGGRNRRRWAIASAIGALAFLALWPLQLGGGLDGFNEVADGALYGDLRHKVSYEAQCTNGLCRYKETGGGLRFHAYTSVPLRNGTWNETHVVQESVLPWAGGPLGLGEEGAALGVALATVAMALLLGSWRTAVVAGSIAALGGLLVDPLKYGGDWAPYPSGHTIGASLMWGLLLNLGFALARRQGVALWPYAQRYVLGAWILVAFAVGFDLVNSGYHKSSDILLGWSFALAFVGVAVVLDELWASRSTPQVHA